MSDVKKIIKSKLNILKNTDCTFETLFNIIHSNDQSLFCEMTNGFKTISVTYGECKKKCIQTANYLIEELKELPKGSYVGLMMENSIYWITSFWGILMSGYKPVLLNVRLGQKLNQEVVELLNIKKIISDKEYLPDIDNIKILDVKLDDYDNITNEYKWEDEIALTTSATTLNIKVCIYKGSSIAEQIKNTKNIVKTNSMIIKHYNGRLKLLTFLPFYHIFGLIATYFWFSIFERSFVFLKDFSSDTILKTVRKHKVTHIFGVPMLWNTIHKEIMKQISLKDEKIQKKFIKGINSSLKLQSAYPRFGLWLSKKMFKEIRNKVFGDSIKFLITGGSYIPDDVLRVINGIGYPLFNGYGMTEVGITSVELRKRIKYRIMGSIGKPFESVKYNIDNDQLQIKGKSICSKIITKDYEVLVDQDEWFNTNDVATVDIFGHYFISGRLDDVVISSSGEKIDPDLIEKNMFLPTAQRFSIISLPENQVYYLSLVVELKPTSNQFKIKKAIEEVDNNVKKLKDLNYNIEKIYFTYDAISSQNAIKVSRSLLHKWIKKGSIELIPYAQMSEYKNLNMSEIESGMCEDIKEIISKVLNKDINQIGIHDHFIFDLGGSSLEYLTLLMKLKENYDVDIDSTENCYNVSSFVKYIVNKNNHKSN